MDLPPISFTVARKVLTLQILGDRRLARRWQRSGCPLRRFRQGLGW